jgi:hypothetical protein
MVGKHAAHQKYPGDRTANALTSASALTDFFSFFTLTLFSPSSPSSSSSSELDSEELLSAPVPPITSSSA